MLGAALPRGTGQEKGVFEGLPGLDGPPKMLEGEAGSNRETPSSNLLVNLLGSGGQQFNL